MDANNPEKPKKKSEFKKWIRKHGATAVTALGGLALSIWVALDNHQRSNRKEQKYYEYLDDKLDVFESAFGLSTLSDSDKPDPKEHSE